MKRWVGCFRAWVGRPSSEVHCLGGCVAQRADSKAATDEAERAISAHVRGGVLGCVSGAQPACAPAMSGEPAPELGAEARSPPVAHSCSDLSNATSCICVSNDRQPVQAVSNSASTTCQQHGAPVPHAHISDNSKRPLQSSQPRIPNDDCSKEPQPALCKLADVRCPDDCRPANCSPPDSSSQDQLMMATVSMGSNCATIQYGATKDAASARARLYVQDDAESSAACEDLMETFGTPTHAQPSSSSPMMNHPSGHHPHPHPHPHSYNAHHLQISSSMGAVGSNCTTHSRHTQAGPSSLMRPRSHHSSCDMRNSCGLEVAPASLGSLFLIDLETGAHELITPPGSEDGTAHNVAAVQTVHVQQYSQCSTTGSTAVPDAGADGSTADGTGGSRAARKLPPLGASRLSHRTPPVSCATPQLHGADGAHVPHAAHVHMVHVGLPLERVLDSWVQGQRSALQSSHAKPHSHSHSHAHSRGHLPGALRRGSSFSHTLPQQPGNPAARRPSTSASGVSSPASAPAAGATYGPASRVASSSLFMTGSSHFVGLSDHLLATSSLPLIHRVLGPAGGTAGAGSAGSTAGSPSFAGLSGCPPARGQWGARGSSGRPQRSYTTPMRTQQQRAVAAAAAVAAVSQQQRMAVAQQQRVAVARALQHQYALAAHPRASSAPHVQLQQLWGPVVGDPHMAGPTASQDQPPTVPNNSQLCEEDPLSLMCDEGGGGAGSSLLSTPAASAAHSFVVPSGHSFVAMSSHSLVAASAHSLGTPATSRASSCPSSQRMTLMCDAIAEELLHLHTLVEASSSSSSSSGSSVRGSGMRRP